MKHTLLVVVTIAVCMAMFAGGFISGLNWASAARPRENAELVAAQKELTLAQRDFLRRVEETWGDTLDRQVTRASDDTRASSTTTDLKTIRSQLQLYKAQHGDTWPTDFAGQLFAFTDAAGRTNATQSPQFRFGPYLLRMPANPYTGVSDVTAVDDATVEYKAAPDMNCGWWYNTATGEFRCHVPDAVVTPEGRRVNRL